jgi:8-oxo-dGTP pyrophosphatase MutT (NUDIX family)
VINEPTASVFVIRRDRQQGWLTALVWHPRLGCWLPAGGHVEPDETPPGRDPRDPGVPCQVNVLKFETLFCEPLPR